MTATGRPADFILKAMDKTTDRRSGRLGVAWMNGDGTLDVVLDPGVALVQGPGVVIKLFPNDHSKDKP